MLRIALGVTLGIVLAVAVSFGLQLLVPWGLIDGSSAAVPGDASRFDPVEHLSEVLQFACPGCVLVSLTATDVRPDGTVDLTRGGESRVEYEVEKPKRGDPSLPEDNYEHVHVKIQKPGSWLEPGHVKGLWMSKQGASRVHESGSWAAPPPCPLSVLWQRSGLDDLSDNARATVEWGRSGATLAVAGRGTVLAFDSRCALRTESPLAPVAPP